MNAPALTISKMTASYNAAPIVSDISFGVDPGEICAVLGANGAGKSTLLRAVMSIVPKVKGIVLGPDGESLLGLKTSAIARRGVAYVQEGRGILYSMTVRENLLVGATALRGEDGAAERQMEAVLQRFPILSSRMDQAAGLLSGGQQQMLAIGRALMSRPRVLLLDEPSLGLAPIIRQEVAGILNDIKQAEGLAVLLVEQDIKLAQACADRAIVIRRGRIADRLNADEIHDAGRIGQLYLGAAPVVGGNQKSVN